MQKKTQKFVQKYFFDGTCKGACTGNKRKKEDIIKIIAARNNEEMCLPYEVLGECGTKPTNCGRNELEVSSMSWTSKDNAKIISDLKGDIISKSCYKIWNKFITWLRLKKVKVMKDFKEEFQWKQQHNETEDALHVKTNDREHEEHKQDKSNERRKAHVYKGTKETLSMQCCGVIGTFTKGVLKITSNDEEFVTSEQTEFEGTRLSDEVMQAMKKNEAIAATNV